MCILQTIIRKLINIYGFIWWNVFGVYNVIEIVVQKYKENRKSPNLFSENVGKSPNLFCKTLMTYIIYRNVTFRYDNEQLT